MVRTAGNVADMVAFGSIEYAVDHLHSLCWSCLDTRSAAR